MYISKGGFTLIELLVVISIIAILSTIVMTSVSSQKKHAKDVSFQSTVDAIQKAAGACCSTGTGVLNVALGGKVCAELDSNYPSSPSLGVVTIERGCDDIDGYSIRLTPGTSNGGTIDYALCDRDKCDFINV